MSKPVRLEINDSGSWRVIARFDAADEERANAILDAAERLAQALVWTDLRPKLTLRVSIDATNVLMRWSAREGWRDALTCLVCPLT